MNAQNAVEELALRLHLQSLEPDEEGLYTFLIDGSHTIFMRLTLDDEQVMFFSGLGSVSPEEMEAVCRALLESNNFWQETAGFTLSLVPGTSSVLLTAKERLSALSGEDLFALFDRFVAAVEIWKGKLLTLAEDAPGRQIHEAVLHSEQEDSRLIPVGHFA